LGPFVCVSNVCSDHISFIRLEEPNPTPLRMALGVVLVAALLLPYQPLLHVPGRFRDAPPLIGGTGSKQ